MPRAKRPLADKDPNVQPPAKRVAEDTEKPRRTRTNVKMQFAQRAFEGQYEYICVGRPPWGKVRRGDDDEEEDDHNSEEEEEDQESKDIWQKPASEHPEWKWIMLKESFEMLNEWAKRSQHCCPDMFDMYVYNDFHGYGMIEILENGIKGFAKELNSPPNFHQMWAIVATMAQFLVRDMGPWMQVDDGDRVEELCSIFGCMILTALNEVERVGQLNAESDFKDLGHVMALFLLWSKESLTTELEDDDNTDWQQTIVAYAKRAEIVLSEQGVNGIQDILDEHDDIEGLVGRPKVDRWNWTSAFKEYRDQHKVQTSILSRPTDNIGGDNFNIMKWTREERAKAAFDEEDPLKDFTDEQIASGDLVMS